MRDLTEILNWRRLNGSISLSGQPTEAQFGQIAESGVTHVINLAPHTNKGALPDEAGTVAELGMTYVHIPVDFDNPTEQDFCEFCEAFERVKAMPVHIHCMYNARVTAFIYRLAQTGKGVAVAEALALMDGIWRPGGVWAAFIGRPSDVAFPNRYAGNDY